MSVVSTLFVYAGIPLAVVLVVAALVFGTGHRGTARYRPGRPFSFAPVWFLSAPPGGSPTEPSSVPAVTAGPTRSALADGEPGAGMTAPAETGGARGTW